MTVRKKSRPQKALDIAPKVVSGALAGSFTTIMFYVLSEFGITPPAEVGAAVTTIVSFVFGWLAPKDPDSQ